MSHRKSYLQRTALARGLITTRIEDGFESAGHLTANCTQMSKVERVHLDSVKQRIVEDYRRLYRSSIREIACQRARFGKYKEEQRFLAKKVAEHLLMARHCRRALKEMGATTRDREEDPASSRRIYS
jgi:hypothetical protein